MTCLWSIISSKWNKLRFCCYIINFFFFDHENPASPYSFDHRWVHLDCVSISNEDQHGSHRPWTDIIPTNTGKRFFYRNETPGAAWGTKRIETPPRWTLLLFNLRLILSKCSSVNIRAEYETVHENSSKRSQESWPLLEHVLALRLCRVCSRIQHMELDLPNLPTIAVSI